MTAADTALEKAAAVLGDLARRDVALGPITTYRVGGPAALFVEARDEADLEVVRAAVAGTGVPVLVIGNGSNLLVADAGFPGVAVVLGEAFSFIEIAGTEVRAGAAASLPVVARRAAAAGLTGFEWAVGVPGSVGGGVRMNAGGHGSDISHSLVRARIADLGPGADARGGMVAEVDTGALGLSYRRSALTSTQVVLGAAFALERGDRETSERRISEIVRWRRQHQPGGANAGSIFTNPPDDSAGRLIESAGLKGLRRGSAFVSPKHANFFQVDDGGSADDVVVLMEEVARLVEERTGVRLEPEVCLVGYHWSQRHPEPDGDRSHNLQPDVDMTGRGDG